jgi:hypothetical protein
MAQVTECLPSKSEVWSSIPSTEKNQHTKKSGVFLYTNNGQSKNEIRKTTPFTTESKRILREG